MMHLEAIAAAFGTQSTLPRVVQPPDVSCIAVDGARILLIVAQAWAIVLKDARVYFTQPPMLMYGLLMPVFIFFSFSVRRDLGMEASLANLLALTTFF